MYSRSQIPKEPYHIPENYRGNAFRGGSATPDIPVAPESPPEPLPEEPKVEPSDIGEPTAEPTASEQSVPVSLAPKKASPSLLSSLLPPKPKGLGGGSILGEIGTEELLIIGIILLLSQNESDDDILLLLLLLLFYK